MSEDFTFRLDWWPDIKSSHQQKSFCSWTRAQIARKAQGLKLNEGKQCSYLCSISDEMTEWVHTFSILLFSDLRDFSPILVSQEAFSFSSLAPLWPKFTSPRFRMLDCLPDIQSSNNVFLRLQIFWFCSLWAFTATREVRLCCEN